MRGAWSGRAGTRRAALGRRRGDGGLRSGQAGKGRSAGLPTLAPEATRRRGCAGATRSGMDSGSVAAERPKRTQGRQRLLSSGCGVPARPGISTLPSGRSWPRPRGRAARASPLLLLLLVPSPRLAATARRRTLVERSRPGLVIPAAALGAGWNALGRLRLGARRVAALVSSRRGEAGGREITQGTGLWPSRRGEGSERRARVAWLRMTRILGAALAHVLEPGRSGKKC